MAMTKTNVSQHPYLKSAGWIAAGTTILLSALAIKYPNRAVFTDNRDDIQGLSGYPLVGDTLTVLKNKNMCYQYMVDTFEKLDVMTMTLTVIGSPRVIITIDPRIVEHILKDNFRNYVKGPKADEAAGDLFGQGIFIADGETWKFQRKTASAIFATQNIRNLYTMVFLKYIRYMNNQIFDAAAANGQSMDFQDTMLKFTLDSFMEIGFGIEALSTNGKIPFAVSFDACQQNVLDRVLNPAFRWTEAIGAWIMPWKTSIQQHLGIIDDFIYGVIEKHRNGWKPVEKRDDLLSLFMSATNENGQPLNNKELRDVVFNFFVAARDTTAQAMSWMVYSLLTNSDVEKKLMAEIKAHITDDLENNPVAMYDTIKKMKYAHATLYESMRLNPGVPGNRKQALNDDVWPDGTRIKKNDAIFWTTYGQGRSTRIWGDDAKEFKPERWLTAEGNLRMEPAGKYSVFNAGPRSCLGQALATMESLVTIVCLLRRYEFTLAPNQEITYKVSMTLPMKNGMYVYVKHRT